MLKSEIEIVKRQLTTKEARIIFNEIKNTPNIIGFTINELVSYKNVFVAMDDQKLAGVGIWIKVSEEWNELLVLFVLDGYRNQGIGSEILNNLIRDIGNSNIFIPTRNAVVIRMLHNNNFKIVIFWELPVEIKIYYFHYSLNLYRIKEFMRKNLLKHNKPFVYGLLFRQ